MAFGASVAFGVWKGLGLWGTASSMSSYYGGGWAVYEVEREELEEQEPERPQETSRGWSHSAETWRSPSTSPWVRTERRGYGHQAEVFDMASSVSSNDSWWQERAWSSDSWAGSSGSGRANWVYVSQAGERDGWGSCRSLALVA